jgi:hypothetical protein
VIRGLALASLLTLAAPAVSAQSSTPSSTRYERARACSIAGDSRCVIRELHQHAETVRELELLIAAMRAVGGYDRDVASLRRRYCERVPCRPPTTTPPRTRPHYL